MRRRRAPTATSLAALEGEIVRCRACPRLVAWREECAAAPPPRFAGHTYWGRPVPGFGDPAAALLLVGLAPAAHGGNRTGRVFTGDSSGDFLFAALHRASLASQPLSASRDDGLALRGAYIAAAVRCAPPGNRPSPGELAACLPLLERELSLLPRVRALLCLGAFAWGAALRVLSRLGTAVPRPAPSFGHGSETSLEVPGRGLVTLVGSYHPSRQNTNTGRLTPPMLDAALARATALAGLGGPAPG